MGRLLCCISISIAFFDENPFKQRKDRSLPDGKRILKKHIVVIVLDLLRGPQAITPPAFLFLSLTMSNSVGRSPEFGARWKPAAPSGSGGLYSRLISRQPPFFALLQFVRTTRF